VKIGGPLNLDAFGRLGVHYLVLESRRDDVSVLSRGWTGPVLTDNTLQVWENPRWVGEAVVVSTAGVTAAKVVRRRDGSVSVATDGASGVLRVDEQYEPEWQVTVDGKAARLVEVDGFSVGVAVPAGQHAVTFSYGSNLFWRGLALAGASLVVLLGVLLFDRQQTEKRYREIEFDPISAATGGEPPQTGSGQTAA
jgi:Bacterial membrane protein YfhO